VDTGVVTIRFGGTLGRLGGNNMGKGWVSACHINCGRWSSSMSPLGELDRTTCGALSNDSASGQHIYPPIAYLLSPSATPVNAARFTIHDRFPRDIFPSQAALLPQSPRLPTTTIATSSAYSAPQTVTPANRRHSVIMVLYSFYIFDRHSKSHTPRSYHHARR
jgi:hypothetical protein